MEKLRPERLDIESSDQQAGKKFIHWRRCAESFIKSLDNPEKPIDKLEVLIQLISHQIYELRGSSNL